MLGLTCCRLAKICKKDYRTLEKDIKLIVGTVTYYCNRYRNEKL